MTKILPSKIIIGVPIDFEINIHGSKSYGDFPYEITLSFYFDDFVAICHGFNADYRQLTLMDWLPVIKDVDWFSLSTNIMLDGYIFIVGDTRFFLAEIIFSRDQDNEN